LKSDISTTVAAVRTVPQSPEVSSDLEPVAGGVVDWKSGVEGAKRMECPSPLALWGG
jgi:hypothetical protein